MATVVLHPETVRVDGHLFFRDANGALSPYWAPLGQAPAPFTVTAGPAGGTMVEKTITPTRPADGVGGWKEESCYRVRQMFAIPANAPITIEQDGEDPVTYAGNDEIVRVHPGAIITWPI